MFELVDKIILKITILHTEEFKKKMDMKFINGNLRSGMKSVSRN